MGNHLVVKKYEPDTIKPGAMVFFRGRMSRVVSVTEGIIQFDDGNAWQPADGEAYEVSEHEEPAQGLHVQKDEDQSDSSS